jgi:hypothetical protein
MHEGKGLRLNLASHDAAVALHGLEEGDEVGGGRIQLRRVVELVSDLRGGDMLHLSLVHRRHHSRHLLLGECDNSAGHLGRRHHLELARLHVPNTGVEIPRGVTVGHHRGADVDACSEGLRGTNGIEDAEVARVNRASFRRDGALVGDATFAQGGDTDRVVDGLHRVDVRRDRAQLRASEKAPNACGERRGGQNAPQLRLVRCTTLHLAGESSSVEGDALFDEVVDRVVGLEPKSVSIVRLIVVLVNVEKPLRRHQQ